MKYLIILTFALFNSLVCAEEDEWWKYYDTTKTIHLQFIDEIKKEYTVSVDWMPDGGLVPMLTGPALISFKSKSGGELFTIVADYFHIPSSALSVAGLELFTDEGYNLSVDLNKTYKVKYSPYKKISLWNNTHHFEESGSREQAPFFFEDIDLDGVDEIVITDFQAGQRHSNEYSVYKNFSRLSKFDYKVIKTEPFDHIDQLTTFNKNSKTISQFHSGGSCANSEDTYKKTNKGFEFVEFTNWDSRPTMEYGYVCTKLTYGIVRDEKVIKSKSESYWDSEKSENIKLGTKYY